MSVRFTRRAKALTFSGIATLGLAAVAQMAVSPLASATGTVTIPSGYNVAINQSFIGTTANSQGCSFDDMANVPKDKDGWLFVTSPSSILAFTATFDGGTVTLANQGATTSTMYFTKPYEHLLLVTSPGATLEAAFALLDNPDGKLVLSHTCAATQETTPSPTVSPTETASPTPTCAVDMDTETPGCQTETPSPSPSETVSPTETASPTPTCAEDMDTETPGCQTESPSVSPTETESPCAEDVDLETPGCQTASPTPTCAEDMDTETPGCQTESPSVAPTETASETPSAEVSATELSQTPSVSPSVKGERVTKSPAVEGSRLPNTGSPLPIALLLLVGFGLLAGGTVVTFAGDKTEGKHRA